MHNMNEIIEKIKEKATKAGYPDASVEVREINKSNKTKTGLILRLQPEDKICPTIYPEEIEPAALDNILDNLIQTAVDAQNTMPIEEIQTNPDFTKLIPCLVNKARNPWVKALPHRTIADLYLYYRLRVAPMATVAVHTELMHTWNLEENDLFHIALNNLHPHIDTLNGMITKILGANAGEESVPVHVVHNTEPYGAACILHPDVIDNLFGVYDDDLLILPSSIHEILVTGLTDSNLTDVANMVKDINRTVVTPEDFLSDNLYIVRRNHPILVTA